MPKDKIIPRGVVHSRVYSRNGELKQDQWSPNVVPSTGEAYIAKHLWMTSGHAVMGWMAIGTGAAAGEEGNTALGSEHYRVALSAGYATLGSASDWVRYRGSFAIDGPHAITEDGIFNTSVAAAGTMLARGVFAAVNLTVGDTIVIDHDIQVA